MRYLQLDISKTRQFPDDIGRSNIPTNVCGCPGKSKTDYNSILDFK